MADANNHRGTLLKDWVAGEPLDHRKLNQVVKAVAALTKGCRSPRQIVPRAGEAPLQMQQFKIVTIDDDLLVCNPFNGLEADTESEIIVAKPPELRASRTSWNGQTFTYTNSQTRSATNGSDTETQLVTPSYVVGDVVFAVSNIIGGTGVTLDDDTPVEWMDHNCAARAWAEEEE